VVCLGGIVPLWVNGVINGGVVGMGAGLAVGAKVKANQDIFLLAIKGGLIGLLAAVPCVVILDITWMILVGFFGQGAGEYFPPGWGSAYAVATVWVTLVGPALAVLGSLVGVAVALCTRDGT
jgi:hypothetical protein